MANNRLKTVAFLLTLAAAFVAGGWFFSRIPARRAVSDEVEQWYSKDGEALGIFDKIPAADMQAASEVADEALQLREIAEPEEQVPTHQDGRLLPSQVMLTDLTDIAGVAPKEEPLAQETSATAPKVAAELNLTGDEVAGLAAPALPAMQAGEQTQISMIAAPVKYFIIRNTEEYKEFKRRARGSYPEVDFGKQMLVVLESDSNLPDNVFEIVQAEDKEESLIVSYRVNVFKLDKKLNSHAVLPVTKTTSAVQLKQVL